jgi:hypothetical protein
VVIRGAQIHPSRPSTWIFGETGGVQVWALDGDPAVKASVLIGHGSPVVIVNRLLIVAGSEHAALAWAFRVIATGLTGYYVWFG